MEEKSTTEKLFEVMDLIDKNPRNSYTKESLKQHYGMDLNDYIFYLAKEEGYLAIDNYNIRLLPDGLQFLNNLRLRKNIELMNTKLDETNKQLEENTKQTKKMIWLTWGIIGLTISLLIIAIIQITILFR